MKARLVHKLAPDIQRHFEAKAAEVKLCNFGEAEQWDGSGYGLLA